MAKTQAALSLSLLHVIHIDTIKKKEKIRKKKKEKEMEGNTV